MTFKNINNNGNDKNKNNEYFSGNNYQNQEDNIENNSVHTSYQYKPSKSIKDNNDYNYNNNNNVNRVNTNYSKKNSSKASNENDYETDEQNLICQNCINEELMDMKRKREYDEKRNDFVSAPFEDKYKSYDLNLINGKIKKREENRNEVANVMNKYKYNEKDKLIYDNENSRNFLNESNGNYLYDKKRDKYEQKEKMINDNINKFSNKERPEISAYFNNYVNNPDYKNNLEYGEYKKKQTNFIEIKNNDSQNKSKTRVNNSSEFITKSNTINQSEKRIVLKSSIEPINKFYSSHNDAKTNLNEYKPYLTFGNFNANKKEIPKIKLYNTVINKLISQSDAICTENQQSLHNFDILAMDKYIENAQSERNKNTKCIKYNSNYYDYINSQKIIPINLKIKRNKKLKYY